MAEKTAPPGGPVVGVQPQAIFLQPLGPARTMEDYKAKHSKVLGIIQIVSGIMILILSCSIIKFYVEDKGSELGMAYQSFCALIFYCLSGGFAIAAGKRRTRCTIITHMVFAILACLSTISLLSATSANIVQASMVLRDEWYAPMPMPMPYDDEVYPPSQPGGDTDREIMEDEPVVPMEHEKPTDCWFFPGGSERRVKVNIAISSLVLVLILVELVATIWSSTLSCRTMCCPKHMIHQTGQPHVVMINGQAYTVAQAPATVMATNLQAGPLPEKHDLNDACVGVTVAPTTPPPPYQ